ncbi:MAG: hypothetical protein IKA32_11245 [Lentisphaeria bacterium]|nr:hypothetical protein [Lentisphaeria bacterium]
MTLIAFLLIFVSVFLHVAWNMLSKGTTPSLAFYSLMSFTASVIWLPFFIASDIHLAQLPLHFYWLVAGSVAGEIIYMAGLAYGYKKSDISLVYPVVRALPVMMVALVTTIFNLGREQLDWCDYAGMLLITGGCFLMPLKSLRGFSLKAYCSSVVVFILMGAIGTTMYTIFDSSAIKIVRDLSGKISVADTLGYLFLIEFSLALGELVIIYCCKDEWNCFKTLLKRPLYPIVAGVCSSSAYGLVLFAMGYVTNVSFLQAFRQISLPVGFIAGVTILHEKTYLTKVIGVAVIVAGLLVMIFC